MERDDLRDFRRQRVEVDGKERVVFRIGEGAPVIVLSEIPGITPKMADLGRRLAGEGFDVWMPSLYGIPGYPATRTAVASRTAWICISKEIRALSAGITRPVADWVRALAVHIQEETGAPGVGAVGLCLTASFVLGASISPVITASVVSQPSMPLPITRRHRRDPGVSAADLSTIRRRVDADELCVLGMRFSHDRLSPRPRFETLQEALGDGFRVYEIDTSRGNPDGIPTTVHSVLGHDYVDSNDHPTRLAFEHMAAFLRERLT